MDLYFATQKEADDFELSEFKRCLKLSGIFAIFNNRPATGSGDISVWCCLGGDEEGLRAFKKVWLGGDASLSKYVKRGDTLEAAFRLLPTGLQG